MMIELKTYDEETKLIKNSTCIGRYHSEGLCDCDIWCADLLRDNTTNGLFAIIITDGDETHYLMKFE